MKKIFYGTITTLFVLLTPFASYANETPAYEITGTTNSIIKEDTIIYQDSEIIITESEIIETPITSARTLFSTASQKSTSKKYKITDNSGNVLAVYTLNATFTYNGKTASCIKSSYSTSIKNSKASFTSASASKSGSTATGKYSLKINKLQTISRTVSITCSKKGVIS